MYIECTVILCIHHFISGLDKTEMSYSHIPLNISPLPLSASWNFDCRACWLWFELLIDLTSSIVSSFCLSFTDIGSIFSALHLACDWRLAISQSILDNLAFLLSGLRISKGTVELACCHCHLCSSVSWSCSTFRADTTLMIHTSYIMVSSVWNSSHKI